MRELRFFIFWIFCIFCSQFRSFQFFFFVFVIILLVSFIQFVFRILDSGGCWIARFGSVVLIGSLRFWRMIIFRTIFTQDFFSSVRGCFSLMMMQISVRQWRRKEGSGRQVEGRGKGLFRLGLQKDIELGVNDLGIFRVLLGIGFCDCELVVCFLLCFSFFLCMQNKEDGVDEF